MTNRWFTMNLTDDHNRGDLRAVEMLVGVQIKNGSIRPVCLHQPEFQGPLSINLIEGGRITRDSIDVFSAEQLAVLKSAGKLVNGDREYRLLAA